jgi:hypothetical protein
MRFRRHGFPAMNKEEKKAAIFAWKERKPVAGIFAVRCAATGEVWVGQSPNLDKAQNKVWFSLRMGGSFYGSLQTAWTVHGENGFTFEALEQLEEEDNAYIRKKQLNARAGFWREKLGAILL